MKVGIINYGGGNLRSVINAFESLGHTPLMIDTPADLKEVTHLIFPGQGAFGQCSAQVAELDLLEPMREWIAQDRPFFGICIGYQLLFQGSDESPGDIGLATLKGQVRHFAKDTQLKVPHMGWNALALKDPQDPMWEGLPAEPYFYFVHSYFPQETEAEDVAATTSYGETFTSAIRRGQVWGCQFHPEKSQHAGIQLLQNFLTHTS